MQAEKRWHLLLSVILLLITSSRCKDSREATLGDKQTLLDLLLRVIVDGEREKINTRDKSAHGRPIEIVLRDVTIKDSLQKMCKIADEISDEPAVCSAVAPFVKNHIFAMGLQETLIVAQFVLWTLLTPYVFKNITPAQSTAKTSNACARKTVSSAHSHATESPKTPQNFRDHPKNTELMPDTIS
ncbi:protein ALKAL-like isoform X1 [Silurus asotus]|uniref:Protein ALKAL-like isoform X1 n=1 Tax=Silurus asotus TaxID=30991 RepID=A0AAD5A6A0_SILAS|nr:protein ALKAL-like isoform X1 [Silurus asotus]